MPRSLRSILVYLLLLLAICQVFSQSPAAPNASPKLPNGVYSILRHAPSGQPPSKLGKHERAVPLAPDEGDNGAPTELLIMSDHPDVALDLAAEPRVTTRADGAQALSVELTHEQAASLLATTKLRLNERVAIVISDEAIMTPRVRSPIADGKLEITTNHGDLAQLKKSLWPTAQVDR